LTDPRASEWTALEIVRQVAIHVSKTPTFGLAYLSDEKRRSQRLLCLHPANLCLPREWVDGKEPTWGEWKDRAQNGKNHGQVAFLPDSMALADLRYTPIQDNGPLFLSVNPVRGLGLLLYGLLKKCFELPAIWNGPGHSDVLNLLPKLLVKEMTCSSWTLGILQGCLQPRAMEKLFHRSLGRFDYHLADDTLHDPIAFLNPTDVKNAIDKCQSVLEDYQLATLNHKARQLTPISIQQLTQPDWLKTFSQITEGVDET